MTTQHVWRSTYNNEGSSFVAIFLLLMKEKKGGHQTLEADGGVFQGLRSGTCSKEWSETGIMEPVRPNGRETGLGFQSGGG